MIFATLHFYGLQLYKDEFEVFFRTKIAEYRYILHVKQDFVVYESLDRIKLDTRRRSALFVRNGKEVELKGVFGKIKISEEISGNLSLLSYLGITYKKNEVIFDVIEWFEESIDFLNYGNPRQELRTAIAKMEEVKKLVLDMIREMDAIPGGQIWRRSISENDYRLECCQCLRKSGLHSGGDRDVRNIWRKRSTAIISFARQYAFTIGQFALISVLWIILVSIVFSVVSLAVSAFMRNQAGAFGVSFIILLAGMATEIFGTGLKKLLWPVVDFSFNSLGKLSTIFGKTTTYNFGG